MIMIRLITFCLGFVTFSIAVADSNYVESPYDSCFDKTLSGEKIIVPCKTLPVTMSSNEIQESLEQFREFERSDIVEEVFKAADERDLRSEEEFSLKKEFSLSRTSNSMFDSGFEERELEKQKNIESYLKFRSKFTTEVAQEMSGVKDSKYYVKLTFINNANFPYKYTNREVFRDNATESYANDWKKIIFEHYLSNGYEQYAPKLDVVHKVVIIRFLVENSDQLARIIEGQPVKSMWHVGTPPTDAVDESSHLPLTM